MKYALSLLVLALAWHAGLTAQEPSPGPAPNAAAARAAALEALGYVGTPQDPERLEALGYLGTPQDPERLEALGLVARGEDLEALAGVGYAMARQEPVQEQQALAEQMQAEIAALTTRLAELSAVVHDREDSLATVRAALTAYLADREQVDPNALREFQMQIADVQRALAEAQTEYASLQNFLDVQKVRQAEAMERFQAAARALSDAQRSQGDDLTAEQLYLSALLAAQADRQRAKGDMQEAARVYQRLHEVRAGDTLRGIAQERLGDAARWQDIATLNELFSDELAVGQRLYLPLQEPAPLPPAPPAPPEPPGPREWPEAPKPPEPPEWPEAPEWPELPETPEAPEPPEPAEPWGDAWPEPPEAPKPPAAPWAPGITDAPPAPSINTRTFTLQHREAAGVVDQVRSLLRASERLANSQVATDPRKNSLIVTGPDEALLQVGGLLALLDCQEPREDQARRAILEAAERGLISAKAAQALTAEDLARLLEVQRATEAKAARALQDAKRAHARQELDLANERRAAMRLRESLAAEKLEQARMRERLLAEERMAAGRRGSDATDRLSAEHAEILELLREIRDEIRHIHEDVSALRTRLNKDPM